MKLNTRLPANLGIFFHRELRGYRMEMHKGNLQQAWNHLERAHILGQAYPLAHSRVHWMMLGFGITIKSPREILGQIPRLLVGGVKSFVGKIPVGNTGGANVPPLKPLPIAPDLLEIFKQANIHINN